MEHFHPFQVSWHERRSHSCMSTNIHSLIYSPTDVLASHFRSGFVPVISHSRHNVLLTLFVHNTSATMPNIQKLLMGICGIKSTAKEDVAKTISTPLNPMRDTENLIQGICCLHSELQAANDLKPSQKINAAFTDLVNACTQTLPVIVTEKVRSNLTCVLYSAD